MLIFAFPSSMSECIIPKMCIKIGGWKHSWYFIRKLTTLMRTVTVIRDEISLTLSRRSVSWKMSLWSLGDWRSVRFPPEEQRQALARSRLKLLCSVKLWRTRQPYDGGHSPVTEHWFTLFYTQIHLLCLNSLIEIAFVPSLLSHINFCMQYVLFIII